MQTRAVPLGTTTLSVTEAGEGAPIVFLHAFPLSARMWEGQLGTLPKGWHGVAPDLRGFAASAPGNPPARHVGDHADDVLALVASLGAGPVVLVGLSMGGYVAFECWRLRPTAIRALVFADTRAEADTADASTRRTAVQAQARRDGTGAVIDGMLPNLLGATTQTSDPHLAVRVRDWAMASPADGVIDALEALKTRPDSRPTLVTITCPTLVLVGAEDALTPPPLSRVIADGVPGATLVEIPEAGHLANIEQPSAFDAALGQFLAALQPA